MTNEKAITILEMYKQRLVNSVSIGLEKDIEAYEVAICALKNEQTDGDLISLDFMKKLGATCIAKRSETGELVAVSSIDNLPSAEKTAELRIVGKTTMHYECSLCGGAVDKWDNYCKHCGAIMKGVE